MTAPHRVRLTKIDGRTVVPAGAVRVDRGSRWRPPFWLDHPFVDFLISWKRLIDNRDSRYAMLAHGYRLWIGRDYFEGLIWDAFTSRWFDQKPPAAPTEDEIQHRLGGRVLADWPELGIPCLGDVLLSIANRREDGSLFPTASDGFRPKARPLTEGELASHRRVMAYTNAKYAW
ncbi:hypothetical protein KHC28_00105 [Ancylobacter sonchi]|uniref:hypothetical protein n=1 Tax=Ancylobacter sonchi TaxID=1937790 RepID=UPI001BD2CB52|nr:hypothetical protein [Ancylobacter sonchi]MBS7532067.1 hypothetical protein [Ancylobacter sonchi]